MIIRAILTFLTCLAAARNLHNKMFKSVLRTPILFFDTNPVGMHYNQQMRRLMVIFNRACVEQVLR